MNGIASVKIDKTSFSTASLLEPSDENAYWHSRTPHARLQALELMCQIIYGYDPSATRLQEFLRLLNAHKVEYLVIGGYAVGYHGYSRATADMDIWVGIHPANADRIVAALKESGFDLPDLSAELFLRQWQIIRLDAPPVRIEIATTISGVDFADCYADRVEDTLDGVPVHLISLDGLKRKKQASGRHQDLADLEHLP